MSSLEMSEHLLVRPVKLISRRVVQEKRGTREERLSISWRRTPGKKHPEKWSVA